MRKWNKIYRLKANREYRRVYSKGKTVVNRELVLYYAKSDDQDLKAGFTVSKKIGKSVVRNRIKRLLKEAFRRNIVFIKPGFHLVFVARIGDKKTDYKTIEQSMIELLKKAELYVTESG